MWINGKETFQLSVNLVNIDDNGELNTVVEIHDNADTAVQNIGYLGMMSNNTESSAFWLNGDDADLLESATNDNKALLTSVDNIYIYLSHFTNGRAFSLAKQLRTDMQFSGNIWAVGSMIPDQYAFALSCGFNGLKLPDNHPEPDHFFANIDAINVAYQQPSYLELKSKGSGVDANASSDYHTILEMRHR